MVNSRDRVGEKRECKMRNENQYLRWVTASLMEDRKMLGEAGLHHAVHVSGAGTLSAWGKWIQKIVEYS